MLGSELFVGHIDTMNVTVCMTFDVQLDFKLFGKQSVRAFTSRRSRRDSYVVTLVKQPTNFLTAWAKSLAVSSSWDAQTRCSWASKRNCVFSQSCATQYCDVAQCLDALCGCFRSLWPEKGLSGAHEASARFGKSLEWFQRGISGSRLMDWWWMWERSPRGMLIGVCIRTFLCQKKCSESGVVQVDRARQWHE
jgi:hypothetical protein